MRHSLLALCALSLFGIAQAAQQVINVGTVPGDHTGDPAYIWAGKDNANFTEVYGQLADDSAQLGSVSVPVLCAVSNISGCLDNTGVADTTANLLAYVNAHADAYIPAGTYLVCGFSSSPSAAQNFHGAGLATKFKTTNSCNLPAIQFNCAGTAPLSLYGFVIDGNSSNQTQDGSVPAHGLYMVSCPTLLVHDIRIQNVAGHGLFASNPASPSTTYSGQLFNNISLYNIGLARGGTYGSAFDITNAYHPKIANVDVDTTAKAAFRLSGVGVNITNSTARNYGNGGVVPVSSVDTDINVVGGSYNDSASFSNATLTGSTHTSTTVNTLSGNALTTGYSAGDYITDSSGDIPAGTTISSVAAGGASLVLSQAATGTHSGDTLTVKAAVDGIRILGNRTSVTGAIICGNQGNGISYLNGATNASVQGNVICNNGQGTAAVGPTDGRSGVKIYNSGTASTDITVTGNTFYDDQGSPTQLYGVEVANSSDRVSICSNHFGTEKTGAIGITTSASNIEVCNDNYGITSKYHDTSTHAYTGGTGEVSQTSFTITASELAKTSELSCRAGGTMTGTAGTKTIKFYFGGTLGDGSGLTIASASAAAPNWSADMSISMNASYSAEKLTVGNTASAGTAAGALTSSPSTDTASAVTVFLTANLTNSADTATITQFSCYRRR